MDPNAALEKARAAALDVIAILDNSTIDKNTGALVFDSEDLADESNNLANAFQALDQWITRGGFLPAAWDEPWQDSPDAPGWWFLNDGQNIRPVLVHAPETDVSSDQWKRIRIPAGR